MAAESTVQMTHTPPNDSQPGQADSSGNVTDLRNLITGKKPLPKLELFTDKPHDNPSQDVRNQAKEITDRNSKFNRSGKIRKIKKSAKHYEWKNYAPPEHQDDYIPPSKRKPAEEPRPSSSNTTSTAGAREASAVHSPAGRGRKRSRPISSYSSSSSSSQQSIRRRILERTPPRRRSPMPRSPPRRRTPSPRPPTRRRSPSAICTATICKKIRNIISLQRVILIRNSNKIQNFHYPNYLHPHPHS